MCLGRVVEPERGEGGWISGAREYGGQLSVSG